MNALLQGVGSARVRPAAPATPPPVSPDVTQPQKPSQRTTATPAAATATREGARPVAGVNPVGGAAGDSTGGKTTGDQATNGNTHMSADSGSEATDRDLLRVLPIDKIRRSAFQPRQHFDKESLQELADSIRAQGLVQPVLVRRFADNYELVAGERRWRAAQLAGLHDIPAIIRELDDQAVAAVALVENIQRKDLNPLEEARALHRLQHEFGMTHDGVAEAVGRSRTAVTNLLRLLELGPEVKLMLERGELDMGHARALLTLGKDAQLELARKVVSQGLSVRATEQLVRDLKDPGPGQQAAEKPDVEDDPDIQMLTRNLSAKLGAAVTIRHNPKGKGKLEISYNSLDELDGILKHIK